jgi:hypothetical protein
LELGGAEMHATVSGVAEWMAENDADGIRLAREVIARWHWNDKLPPRPARSFREPLYDIDELCGGRDGTAVTRSYDECCDARGPPFLTVLTEDPGEVGFVVCCDDLCCGKGLMTRVHPHVQRGVLLEGEAPFDHVYLRRRYAEIHEEPVDVWDLRLG